MSPALRRLLALLFFTLLLVTACGDDGGSEASSDDEDGTEQEDPSGADDGEPTGDAFCEAAGDFGTAQSGAPDADTPEEVEERVTAMSDAADAIFDTAPAEIAEQAQAFADAIAGLEAYAAERGYEVDLGGGAPEYQSGEGAQVAAAITETIGPVDQAVQDECDRFLSEAA